MRVNRVVPLVAGLLLAATQAAFAEWPSSVTFTVNDTPGHWFDAGSAWDLPDKDGNKLGGRSLVVVEPDPTTKKATVHFKQRVGAARDVESFHTVTNLVWPSAAGDKPVLDQDKANWENHTVQLDKPGLYVFVCKLHPYMLGAVVVDDSTTEGVDLGSELMMLGGPEGMLKFPTVLGGPTDIALRLLRAFFIVTTPNNWKDYSPAKVGSPYLPQYPFVPVNLGGVPVPDLNAALQSYFVDTKGIDGKVITADDVKKPSVKGIGEVWVDTAYELSAGKKEWYPGTATVVSATNWNVTKKIALPQQNMNNGHNFWTSHDQKEIYQTEWHGNSSYVIDRKSGKLLQEIDLVKGPEVKHLKFKGEKCHDPAHVMTRVDTQQVHVGCNGGDSVAEFNRTESGLLKLHRFIKVSKGDGPQTQPHAHWMGFDGKSMITPNSNSGDATTFDFREYQIIDQQKTGTLPIASGMMPDSSKYYVSNYLGHTISVVCGQYPKMNCVPGQVLKNINLLVGNSSDGTTGNYNPISGEISGPVGGFSVQTPVSPDGKFVIQGNTLTGTITIIDTATDTLVAMAPCDPGCHGVNFGAKKGGGYYAYVTSKFANRLIVLDYDVNNDGIVTQEGPDAPVIAGTVMLVNDNPAYKDDTISGNRGFGAQGIMAVPNIYNGWVQRLPGYYKAQLTKAQQNPIGKKRHSRHDDDDDDDRGHGRDDDR